MSSGSLVIAHRGASAGRPGNTLEAFEAAIDAGADMIEFDVRRTRFGELIVHHDPTIHGHPIGRMTRAEAGERLGRLPPLLSEVLDLAAGRTGVDVELKEPGYVEQVLDVLDARMPAEDVLVTSFHSRVVAEVKRRMPEMRAGLVLGVTNFGSIAPVPRALRCGADTILLRRKFAERGLLGRAYDAGLAPVVWTVNDDAGLRRHLHDPRVSGVVTDVPERAVALRRLQAA